MYFYGGGSGTLHELSEVLHGHVEDSYGSSRVGIWRECLRLFGESPVTGGGPDTLVLRTDMTFSRYVEETGSTLSTHVDNAHCEILSYLVNLGLLGALPYVALCAGSLRRAVLLLRPEPLRPRAVHSRSARLDIYGPRVLREGVG